MAIKFLQPPEYQNNDFIVRIRNEVPSVGTITRENSGGNTYLHTGETPALAAWLLIEGIIPEPGGVDPGPSEPGMEERVTALQSQVADLQSQVDVLQAQSTKTTRVNLSGQNDVNSSLSGVQIQLEGVDENFNGIPGLTVVENQTLLDPGVYEFDLQCSLSGFTQRANQKFSCHVDGDEIRRSYISAYIRNSSGHNEAQGVFSDLILIAEPQTPVVFYSARISNASETINLIADHSRLIWRKLS